MFKPNQRVFLRKDPSQEGVVISLNDKDPHKVVVDWGTHKATLSELDLVRYSSNSQQEYSFIYEKDYRTLSKVSLEGMLYDSEQEGDHTSAQFALKALGFFTLLEESKIETIDLNGHFMEGRDLFKFAKPSSYKGILASHLSGTSIILQKDWFESPPEEERGERIFVSPEEADLVFEACENGETLDRFYTISKIEWYNRTCPFCEVEIYLETNGTTLRIKDSCPNPQGYPLSEWELNVPSGKMVIANDLRNLFPIPELHVLDPLHHHAQVQASQYGLSMGYVGNTCPNVFLNWEKDSLTISPEDKREGEEKVHTILTSLWWYCIADYDELLKRTEHFGGSLSDVDGVVVEVDPGVYTFSHNNLWHLFDKTGEEFVYAQAVKTREPDPVENFLQKRKNHLPSPGQYILNFFKRSWETHGEWEELTPKQKINQCLKISNQLLCTLGNGIEFNEWGYPEVYTSTREEVEIPAFDYPYPWSQISRNGFLGQVAGINDPGYPLVKKHTELSPEYCKLALNICQSIISFGCWDDSFEENFKSYSTKKMLKAIEIYRGLREKYPDVVFDKTFDLWVQDKERVREWILNFKHLEIKRI